MYPVDMTCIILPLSSAIAKKWLLIIEFVIETKINVHKIINTKQQIEPNLLADFFLHHENRSLCHTQNNTDSESAEIKRQLTARLD